ncbi:MAG: hypothetical protein M3Y82_01530 [Verrucomicrobiota bacterium]|nr:hypothetical protein [Verrucomicrobiota bacterium]
MKYYFVGLIAVAFLTGCYTSQQVSQMKGHGSRETFKATYDQVWRAAVDAAQVHGLQVHTTDRANGYLGAGRGVRLNTFGENVGIWVKENSPSETEVEVVSRQAGPPVIWLKNWEKRILSTISANLTREGSSEPIQKDSSEPKEKP